MCYTGKHPLLLCGQKGENTVWTGIITAGLLTVSPDGPFDPAKTLFCGQCFRWQAEPDGSFSGIVRNRKVRIRTLQDGVQLWGFPEEEAPFYLHYFALDEDYCAIQKRLRRSRVSLPRSTAPRGSEWLHQDFFEVLESFIISQNNNIPRIRGIIERLCTELGKPLEEGGYTFPTPEALAPLQKEDLAFLRAGWRADYLLDAARRWRAAIWIPACSPGCRPMRPAPH